MNPKNINIIPIIYWISFETFGCFILRKFITVNRQNKHDAWKNIFTWLIKIYADDWVAIKNEAFIFRGKTVQLVAIFQESTNTVLEFRKTTKLKCIYSINIFIMLKAFNITQKNWIPTKAYNCWNSHMENMIFININLCYSPRTVLFIDILRNVVTHSISMKMLYESGFVYISLDIIGYRKSQIIKQKKSS